MPGDNVFRDMILEKEGIERESNPQVPYAGYTQPSGMENIKLNEDQKLDLFINQSKKASRNPQFNDDERKVWEQKYKTALKARADKQASSFTTMIDDFFGE